MAVGTSPLRTASSTSVCLRTVVSCWVAGDCVSHPACCAMVWVRFQSVRVSSPLYRGHALKWSMFLLPRGCRCIWCILLGRGSSGAHTICGIW